MRMARGVSGIDCPPIGALVLTHGASRIAAHDDAVAANKGLVARVQHGRPLALRLGAHRHTCGCIADVVGAADGDYCVLHGASRVGVCIYRVGHSVYTGQGHSQSFFGGVA